MTAQTEASRLALLLCEDWRGIQGDLSYDPITFLGDDLEISLYETADYPEDFNLLGSYVIQLDSDDLQDRKNAYNINYYATLLYKDIEPGLRALNVVIAWKQKETNSEAIDSTDKTYSLTLYTLL